MTRIFLILAVLAVLGGAAAQAIDLVPRPVELERGNGTFKLDARTVIVFDDWALNEAVLLAERLRRSTGLPLKVRPGGAARPGAIVLRLPRRGPAGVGSLGLAREGYRLTVEPCGITVEGGGRAGLFYGCQTLLQLLPPAVFSPEVVEGVKWTVPAVKVVDAPRFPWRGGHLDVCRHYMPPAFLRRFVDLLALHKMNVFHLHLTEDQGWRMEIKKYPRLTTVGAWREQTLVGHARDNRKNPRYDGKRHGGYYTQEFLRELVAYAAARHVTIVPEIEMPGHSQAAIAAYPRLGNTGKKLPVFTRWGVNRNIFNAQPETIAFLQDVLTEVLEIFPSRFIHIGGDEAPKFQWKRSPAAQKRIKELGLKDEHELQSWFIRQMDTWLTQRGRRLVGWDEILEGGLAPGATVMSWRGEKGGITAARAGHDVVMAPTTYTYFDYYQGPRANEPLAIGGMLPLRKVYGYDPIPKALTPAQAGHILGVQGQVWTEYIPTPAHAEYMAYPRMTALAEVAWTPQKRRAYKDFRARLTVHLKRLDAMGVRYRKPAAGE